MTDTQYKALLILEDTEYLGKFYSAAGFAEKMWPDSTMHTSSKNQGNGATRGKAAWLCGGSYLGKLSKNGWVDVFGHNLNRFYLTREGKKALAEATNARA